MALISVWLPLINTVVCFARPRSWTVYIPHDPEPNVCSRCNKHTKLHLKFLTFLRMTADFFFYWFMFQHFFWTCWTWFQQSKLLAVAVLQLDTMGLYPLTKSCFQTWTQLSGHFPEFAFRIIEKAAGDSPEPDSFTTTGTSPEARTGTWAEPAGGRTSCMKSPSFVKSNNTSASVAPTPLETRFVSSWGLRTLLHVDHLGFQFNICCLLEKSSSVHSLAMNPTDNKIASFSHGLTWILTCSPFG